MTALSMEVRQKLESIRPRTIGQAGRIDGMTPAALTLLVAHVRRGRESRRARESLPSIVNRLRIEPDGPTVRRRSAVHAQRTIARKRLL